MLEFRLNFKRIKEKTETKSMKMTEIEVIRQKWIDNWEGSEVD